MKLNFLDRFSKKKLNYSISLKSFKWESSCFLRTDGRTDRHDETNSRFSEFCERFQKVAEREIKMNVKVSIYKPSRHKEEVKAHYLSSLISALGEGKCLAHVPTALTPEI